jgi:hypothetical protein
MLLAPLDQHENRLDSERFGTGNRLSHALFIGRTLIRVAYWAYGGFRE